MAFSEKSEFSPCLSMGRHPLVQLSGLPWVALESREINLLHVVLVASVHERVAAEKNIASLPCDVYDTDQLTLVLWFRHGSNVPIYIYDARAGVMSESHRPSESIRGRARFLPHQKPPVLQIQEVSVRDEASYICRVDFQRQPTRYTKVNLTIIEPPGRPIIWDGNKKVSDGTLVGPFPEGGDLRLKCTVDTGRPRPTLVWYRNGVTIDTYCEKSPDYRVFNELTLSSLERKDLNTRLECIASNSNLTVDEISSVRIDLYLKPANISLEGADQPFKSGMNSTVRCRVFGSRPAASVYWTLAGKSLSNHSEQSDASGNITESILSFWPEVSDDQEFLTCYAENPHVESSRLTVARKISVHYPPEVRILFGKTLNASNIKVGDDVYFECDMKANPDTLKITWSHNGETMTGDRERGIIVTGGTLILQSVTRGHAGFYQCHAQNVHGHGHSSELELSVKYPPECHPDQRWTYGATLGEVVYVLCQVKADPPPTRYRWAFNTSTSPPLVIAKGKEETLTYIPKSHLELGSVLCWAENSVGSQGSPCTYTLQEAGPPDPPRDCRFPNGSSSSGPQFVECEPGLDGGLSQSFLLQVFDLDTGNQVYNASSPVPRFDLTELPEGISYSAILSAFNQKGRSEDVRLDARTAKLLEHAPPEESEKKEEGWPMTQFLVVLASLAGIFIVGSICAVVRVRRTRKARTKSTAKTNDEEGSVEKPGESLHLLSLPQGRGTENEDEDEEEGVLRAPDIITHDRTRENFGGVMTSNATEYAPMIQRVRSPPMNKVNSHHRFHDSPGLGVGWVRSQPPGGVVRPGEVKDLSVGMVIVGMVF
ncbi:unnamed protein product [Darwinula stevensoni]|uniref:Ig-like domain-containing protein n=1 Tax=Darwinula stevensoni TaxID=69355 RepID=A0A7R8WZW5_9CRUS|nr:unnamed protein product [Darwinula stevensoni]CAG0881024.1 unnamed protein product [Darwinula stevensoni]